MKKKIITLFVLAATAFQLSGCTNVFYKNDNNELPTESVKNNTIQTEEPTPVPEIDRLTLEEKVGQLFILRPDDLVLSRESESETGVTNVTEEIINTINQYSVGGVCLFAKNIVNPEQLLRFNSDLQAASDIPMFITVDEEGGSVARLANNESFDLPKYKSAAAVASSGNTNDAKEMGRTIGTYLSEYGFNMNFAPDADVNTNPKNPVIGKRAFSSNARIAAEMAAAAADGFRESGIIPTLKHFPGHGDTNEDSHSSLAITYKTLEELQECEFLPFEYNNGKHCVMVGHIATPKINELTVPSSLSADIVKLIPNKEDSLIVTDSLSMKAITDTFNSGEAAIMAINAGCDVLLMPLDFIDAYDAVLEAVKSGYISKNRLNESVQKILDYKHSVMDFEID